MAEEKKKRKIEVSRKKTKSKIKPKLKIVIDREKGLVFKNESDAVNHFQKYIDHLTEQYKKLRPADDFKDEEQVELDDLLEETLDDPDQIWYNDLLFKDQPIYYFLKAFEEEGTGKTFFYLAAAYMSSDENAPTFIFTHFPTYSEDLAEKFVSGELVFDVAYESVKGGAIEGDALREGDPLSMGLYVAMIKVRSDKDLVEEEFQKFSSLREETIENPDEIWRKHDLLGNTLVTFIREFPDHEIRDLFYIVVTQEEPDTNVHSLLFSFPTTDRSLVDRYQQGENLQAEEVVQESSH